MRVIRFFFFLGFSLFVFAAEATPTPDAAVASAHPLATEAGIEIIKNGGNAFDAAVAVTAVLAVAEPTGSGLGGGGFYLLHQSKDNKFVFLDAREKAPLAAHANMYLDDKGNVIENASRNGPLSAGIPGIPAAMAHLATRYGKLPLAQSLAKAIEIAKKGFKVDHRLKRMANWRKPVLAQSPEAAKIFLRSGDVPNEGTLIVQKDLAKTLEAIAKRGRAGFYQGSVAKKLVKGVRAAGGIWQLDDLKKYQVVERKPIEFQYGNFRFITAPPPSSGGIVLAEIFNILSAYDLEKLKDADRVHLTVEAMRRAYRDRASYLGDSDFVKIPFDQLLSLDYAAGLRASIRLDKATPSDSLPGPESTPKGSDTTHFSILDHEGNRVAATLSINLPFGSGYIAPGTGVLLNDEMDDFAIKPGVANAYGLLGNHANAIEAEKRPLSSMSPTFVEGNGKVAILGTPGGSRIITMVLLGAMEFMKNEPVDKWVEKPRFHHQYSPDRIQFEPGALSKALQKSLEEKGHTLKPLTRQYGNMHAIYWNVEKNTVSAASDPRGIGKSTILKK